MDASIFIRSYRKDFQWLSYCVRSIRKYCSEDYREIVLTYPEDDDGLVPTIVRDLCDKCIPVKPQAAFGYVDQQITKMKAHHYCQHEMIVYIDSDYVFTQPSTPADFMRNGKVFVLMTPYSVFEENRRNNPQYDANVLKWRTATRNAIGINPDYEFMRWAPAVFNAETLRCVERDYPTLLTHHCPRLKGTFDFSEFNVLGAYAYVHHPEIYTFVNTETDEMPRKVIKQHWSWGGLSGKIAKYLDKVCQ